MAFLEILTRTFNQRPNLLAINQASLQRLTDPDWTQTMLVDEVGRGVSWANQSLAAHAPNLVGEWIWALDDDDTCIYPGLVGDLKAIAAEHDPDIVMVRMDHGNGRILPSDLDWGYEPQMGRIGGSAPIVRRAVWQAHADAWGSARYESDFDFICALWAGQHNIYWHDVIASRVMRQSFGQPEAINPWHIKKHSLTRPVSSDRTI